VKSRNHSSFDDIDETELQEENTIFSKNERYKSSNADLESPKCSNYNKLGNVVSRCYLKDRKDTGVNQLSVRNENREKTVILLVIIAKVEGTWRNIVGNPRSV
jgi:hypothetical protein